VSADRTAQTYPFAVPGTVLDDKFQVERVLGQGGMGIVVAATHLRLNQRVALKFLLPEACQTPGVVARFLREAQAAAQLQSEHVGHVTDAATLADGTPYLVMEFLEGCDLSDVLRARGPLPVAEAADDVVQACLAVAEAHEIGIVHRDLKPANLFMTRRRDGSPLIKVLDFGIAKSVGESAVRADLTGTGMVMGSPAYMSPEQVRSAKLVDARTDIWSLGVILHELLSGSTPFVADTVSALLVQIAVDPPVPLAQMRPDVPPELQALVAQCLEKDPNRRVQTVAELGLRLSAFASPEARADAVRTLQGRAQAAPPPWGTQPAAAQAATGGWGQTQKPYETQSRRVGIALFLAVSLIVVAVGAAALLLRRSAPVSASGPAPLVSVSAASSPAAVVSAPSAPSPTVSAPAAPASIPEGTASARPTAVAPPRPRPALPALPRPTHVGGQVDPLDDRR
jgi:eukaryotic-like serine/threonine-protein kinase